MIKNFVKKWLKVIRYHFGLGVYSDKYPSLRMKPVVIAKKRYWKFTDDTMMPTMRALAYMNTLEMFDHRINQKDIEFFCEAIDGQMKQFVNAQQDGKTLKGISNLQSINGLVQALRKKNEIGLSTDMIYHLASVVYLDENESPYEYDPELQDGKIKHWKEHGQYFFYELPVKELLPASITSQEYYQSYILLLMEEEKKLTDFLRQIQS